MSNPETSQAGRCARWERCSAEVSRLTDKLGTDVDAGIKDTVVALRLYDINTTGSCEGHIDRGSAAPWVSLAAPKLVQPEAQRWEALQKIQNLEESGAPEHETAAARTQEQEIRRQIHAVNLREAVKLIPLLDEYYVDRRVPADRRLVIAFFANGRARLQSQGAVFQEVVSDDIRIVKLGEYQREVRDFAAFLKKKFFAG